VREDRITPFSKAELLEILRKCAESEDQEDGHYEADQALIRFINDPEITEAYEKVGKWYA
jgi:hypothetical protein